MSKKTFLKPETKVKLNKIVDEVFRMYGKEAPNLSNIKTIIKSTAGKLAAQSKMIGMSDYTLFNHHDYIIKQLNFVIAQDLSKRTLTEFVKGLDGIKEVKPVEDDIRSITITYQSGKKRTFIEVDEIDEKTIKQPKLWLGLFDYVDDKHIYIRRDKRYIGCNVKSLESIIENFKSLIAFKEWCIWARDLAVSPKFKANIDTPKDIEFLNEVIAAINKRQQNNWL